MPRIKIQDQELKPEVSEVKPEVKMIDEINALDGELQKKSGRFLTAFCAFPDKAKFSGETAEEKLILLMRAHVITTVPWILATVLLVVGPIYIVPWATEINLIPMLPSGFKFVLGLLWFLAVFAYAFLNFLYWYFNVYIVTNERIVDVDWFSLIRREMSVAQIAKIQDISSQQQGVFAGFFDYGHVLIQTAGELPNFDFTNVPHPQLVVRKIQELMQIEEDKQQGP